MAAHLHAPAESQPHTCQQEAKAAYEAGVMTSNSDICYVAHESSRLDEGPGNGFANQMLEDPLTVTTA
jgi:hypothetical protein